MYFAGTKLRINSVLSERKSMFWSISEKDLSWCTKKERVEAFCTETN